MITDLTIKKVASFDDNGAQINNLKKVNFFFGYNGSGKTTIAKYLYNISLEDNQKSPEYKYCSEVGYDKTKNQLLAFDENYIETNFIKNPFLKGVFSLNT